MAKTIGFGSKLAITTDTTSVTFADVAFVRNISGPSVESGEVEATTLDSTAAYREMLLGLIDPGNMTFEIAWDPADANGTHIDLTAAQNSRTLMNWKLVLPTTTQTITFTGRVQSFSPTVPFDDLLTANVSVRISGLITWPA